MVAAVTAVFFTFSSVKLVIKPLSLVKSEVFVGTVGISEVKAIVPLEVGKV